MSELKWNWVYYPYLDAPNEQEESALKAGYIKVVDKSEADKVFAEKDEKIDELKEHIDELQKATDSAWSKVNGMYDELRYQKFKRCLAMWLYLRECYWRCKNHNEQTRADWYNKWMNVFQKLAEKFKESK